MKEVGLHYRRTERRLRALLRRAGRSPPDSDDLVQAALLKLHEYCRTNRVDNADAFLVRTVKNLSIDWYRSDRRHRLAERPLEELDSALADGGAAPDVILEAQQRLKQIGQTLEAVSPRTRDIYFAHRAGYSYAEIGKHMQVAKSTIEKHIARAVLALMDMKDTK